MTVERDEPLVGQTPGADGAAFAEMLPGYELLEEIQSGAQGVVYRAYQRSTKREVAVKVIRGRAMSSANDRIRFEREAQILGQLKHPNVVTIHDSGYAGNTAFFVMDYIPGQPLDEYTAATDLTIDEAFRLFAKVCDAVNAAHLRGVIHRDLKPANIRIAPNGEPHVLDFGLAKFAESAALTGGSSDVISRSGDFIGTLAWASPEQAAGHPEQIDIRTDVYSLGVILYHLLTGRFPYDVDCNLRAVLDNIFRAEPAPMRGLRRGLTDEIETLVRKCLSKEPERRYQGAGALANDIRRYLDREPIEAKRDSVAYVLRKQLRKHWVPAAIAIAFLLVITVGFFTTFAFWQQTRIERNQANLARADAESARDAEKEQRGLAEAGQRAAERHAAEAQRQLREAEWQAYAAGIAAADAALRSGDAPAAERRLDRTPHPLMNWEWWHLSRRIAHASGAERDVLVLSDLPARPRSVAFGPDATRLVLATDGGGVLLAAVSTGELVAVLEEDRGENCAAAFCADGALIVTGGSGGMLRLWDAATGAPAGMLPLDAEVRCVASSPASSTIAAGCSDGTVVLWDVRERIRERDHDAATPRTDPDRRGQSTALLDIGQNETYSETLRSPSPNQEARFTLADHTAAVHAVAFSPDGRRLAAGGADGTIRLWETTTRREAGVIHVETDAVRALVFSPDGALLACASVRAGVTLWDVRRGRKVVQLRGHEDNATSVAFSPDGARLVVGSYDATVALWDLDRFERILTLYGHSGSVRAVAFSPDGACIASASADATVRIWMGRLSAESLVADYFEQLVRAADVIEFLEADDAMDPSLRAVALRIAKARGDDDAVLDQRARQILDATDSDSQSPKP